MQQVVLDEILTPTGDNNDMSCINLCLQNNDCVGMMLSGELCYLLPRGTDLNKTMPSSNYDTLIPVCDTPGKCYTCLEVSVANKRANIKLYSSRWEFNKFLNNSQKSFFVCILALFAKCA